MEYALHIAILVAIYVMLSASLNLIAGYAGLVSIGHAAFYGLGAYVVGLLALRAHTPFGLALACACAAGGVLGLLLGWPSLRLKDNHFVMATFAFQVMTFSVLNNWVSLTGGPLGLPGIPRPALFGVQVSSELGFLLLGVLLCLGTLLVCRRVVTSPFGRTLKAIREDETFAQSCGTDVASCKITVLAVAGGLAATAGSLYAYYVSFIDPSSFTVMESIFILAIVIIGGAGNLWGSIVGAVVLVTLPELLRFVGLPNAVAANTRQMLYGALLVAFVVWRPQGLLGEYAFRKRGRDA